MRMMKNKSYLKRMLGVMKVATLQEIKTEMRTTIITLMAMIFVVTLAQAAGVIGVTNTGTPILADSLNNGIKTYTISSWELNGGNTVVLYFTGEGTSGVTAKYGTQDMTVVQGIKPSTPHISAIAYIINPTASTADLEVSWAAGGNSENMFTALSLSNVGSVVASDSTDSGNMSFTYTTTLDGGFVVGGAVNNNYSGPAPTVSGNPDTFVFTGSISGNCSAIHAYGDIATAGTYTDTYAGSYAEASVVFEVFTPDITPPEISILSPASNATDVVINTDLVAAFSEPIALTGNGTITVTNLDDNSSIEIDLSSLPDSDATVSMSGTNLTIDLAVNLGFGMNYAVHISTNAIKDLAAPPNPFAGITNDTTWSFTTALQDTALPTIVAKSPADGATDVAVDTNLVASFSEPIALNTNGTITVRNLDGGADIVIDLTGADPDATVNVSGTNLTIDLAVNLGFGTNYAVRISTNAIQDLALTPNAFAGILDDTTWNFTTIPPETIAPTIVAKSPADGETDVSVDTNLVASFSEPIALTGTGTITVRNLDGGADIVIDLSNLPDPDATINVSGTNLTIDLAVNLGFGTNYAVRISSDAILDLSQAQNAFAGILDDTTWNFTTIAPETTPPSIIAMSPADGDTGVLPGAKLVATFDEPITLKSGGTITITDLSDGSSTRVMTLTNALITSLDGMNVVIALDSALEFSTSYSVQISPDAIEDQSPIPNAFSGITDDTTWNFTTFARPPLGEIVLMDTGFHSQPYSGLPSDRKYVLSSADLDGFEPAGCDKLVLAFSGENLGTFQEISYGGVPMTQIVVVAATRSVAIFYLDNPAAGGDLVVDFSGGNGVGLSVIALVGTLPDYVSPPSSAEATSTSIATTADGSLVVAAAVNNNSSGCPSQTPLTPLFSIDSGSSGHGSGYQQVALSGSTITPTFPSALAVVAVEFQTVTPPQGTVIFIK